MFHPDCIIEPLTDFAASLAWFPTGSHRLAVGTGAGLGLRCSIFPHPVCVHVFSLHMTLTSIDHLSVTSGLLRHDQSVTIWDSAPASRAEDVAQDKDYRAKLLARGRSFSLTDSLHGHSNNIRSLSWNRSVRVIISCQSIALRDRSRNSM